MARRALDHEKKTLKPNRRTKYTDEGMCIEYTPRLYNRKDALKILRRLEDEIEYESREDSTVKIQGQKNYIRRKHVAHGDPGLLYTFSERTMVPRPWTPLLLEIKTKVEKHTGTKYNFVLINRYKDGMDRIGAHRDDEGDLVEAASIGGLSFGTPRDFLLRHHTLQNPRMKPKTKKPKFGLYTIRLGSGSFIEMLDPTNLYWFHEVPARKSAGNNPRVSLTFRVMKPRSESDVAPPKQRIQDLPALHTSRKQKSKKTSGKPGGKPGVPPPPPKRGRATHSVTGGNYRLHPMPPLPPPAFPPPPPPGKNLNPDAKAFVPGEDFTE